jgi:hypothetical protein
VRGAVIVLIAGAAMALLGGVQSAAAGPIKIERSTTVQFEDLPGSTGDRVFGQLSIGAKSTSSHPALAARCLAGQEVQIKHTLTAPGGGSPPVTVVGKAATDSTGAWELASYEASGYEVQKFDTFQVEVPKHRLGRKTASGKRVCLGASGFVTVLSD